jgi:drug/metabolite transporter (DMT)-like permease
MKLIDLITIIGLIIGLFLAIITYILLKRKKLKAKALPYVFGVGGWIYALISMMTASMLLRPISEFANFTIENLFWSLALGVACYFSGHILARRFPN